MINNSIESKLFLLINYAFYNNLNLTNFLYYYVKFKKYLIEGMLF